MNANWVRWCKASLVVHFKSLITPLHIEGEERPKNEVLPRHEFRLDGPYFEEISHNCFNIDVEINILITSVKSATDAYAHERLVGTVVAAFTNCITVREYGDGDEFVGYFNERSGKNSIIVSNFGVIDPGSRLLQSTVEGHYRMSL